MDEMIQKNRDFYLPQKMKPDILRYFRSYDGKHGTQFAVHAANSQHYHLTGSSVSDLVGLSCTPDIHEQPLV